MTLQELERQYKATGAENINDFIWAIRSCVKQGSIPTLQMMGFLNKVISSYSEKAQMLCDATLPTDETSSAELLCHGKILAANILLLQQTRSYRDLAEKLLLLLQWSACLNSNKEDLTGLAVKCMSYQCTEPGFTWDTIKNAISLSFIVFHISSNGKFSKTPLQSLFYHGKGSVCLENGELHISSCMDWRSGARAWELSGAGISVHTRNSREEKLKASCIDNAAQLSEFAKGFTATQAAIGTPGKSIVKEAKVGGTVTLKCHEIREEDGSLSLDAMPMYSSLEKVGTVLNEELLKGIWTEDLLRYVYEGDCIKDAELVDDKGKPTFSIRKAYLDFSRKAAEEDLRRNTVFEAVAICVNKDIQRINWMTAGGYGAISLMMDGIKEGSKAVLTVKNVQSNGYFINVESPKYGYEQIDRRFDEEQVLTSFLTTEAKVWEEVSAAAEKTNEEKTSKLAVLTALARVMYHNTAQPTLERYRLVLSSLFLSTCIEDMAGMAMAGAEASYLGKIIAFAQGADIRANDLPASMTDERKGILGCLALFSKGTLKDFSPLLCQDGITGNIAALLAGKAISEKFSDDVKTDGDTVRKKICTLLGVSDCFISSQKKANGKYGQTESSNLEFKSSYVFSNYDGEPDLVRQGRGQVFEAVCGLLNRDGGTVYIGVNDEGDPILSENSGIKGDIAWFRANFPTVLAKRMRQLGHGIPNPDTIEHYALFLSQEKKLYFKDSVLDKIDIEPTEDGDAIRITVKPSLYEIAYLYEDETHTRGIAYRRDAGSTLPMTEKQKQERLMDQKQISKEVRFAVILQQACDQQRKVILKGYHSGNSGEVRDRLVVPINLFYNDENVLCYDLEAHCEKQFRLARITDIDTDVPSPSYTHDFKPKTADVFRWIGDDTYHIKVRMEVGAYNYLLEEYSTAKDLPSNELYQDADGKWILDTHLHGLGAIRRFYLGLADKMEILPTEDSGKLMEELRRYSEKHMTFLTYSLP